MVKELRKIIRNDSVLEKISREMKYVGQLLLNPVAAMNCGYNLHKVEIDSTKYWAADAKATNRAMGSGGRGNYRYLYDAATREFAALAMHKNNGSYRLFN